MPALVLKLSSRGPSSFELLLISKSRIVPKAFHTFFTCEIRSCCAASQSCDADSGNNYYDSAIHLNLLGQVLLGLTPELSRTAARNGGVVHVTMQPSREAVSA